MPTRPVPRPFPVVLRRFACACALLSLAAAVPTARGAANLLVNPGFEAGLAGWTPFGNAYPETATPHTGTGDAKMFGAFNGGFGVSGLFQTFPAIAGQTYEMESWSRHNTGDQLIGAGPPDDNWAVQKIVFFNEADQEIGANESAILSGTSPLDTWIDNPLITATAPAGTDHTRAVLLFLQPGPPNDGGAGLFDDVHFGLVPEPSALSLLGVAGVALLRRGRRRA
jgi:hypothetical protein